MLKTMKNVYKNTSNHKTNIIMNKRQLKYNCINNQKKQQHQTKTIKNIMMTMRIMRGSMMILLLIIIHNHQQNVIAFSLCSQSRFIKATTSINKSSTIKKPLTRIKRLNQLYYDQRTYSSRASLYSILYATKDDNNDDDEDDDDDLYFGKFKLDDNDIMQSLEPTSSSPSLNDKHNNYEQIDETKFKIEQQQKQIDMLMEMMKNQSIQQQEQLQEQKEKERQQQGQSQKVKSTSSNNDSLTLPPPLPGMFDDRQGEDELQYTDNDDGGVTKISSSSSTKSFTSSNLPLAPLKVMLFIDGTWLYYSLHRRKEDRDPIVQKFGRGWQYRYKFDWNALPRIICEELVGQHKNLVRDFFYQKTF